MNEASCHCGNVRIEFSDLPATMTSCNCSICRRLGALWAYYPAEEVTVTCENEPTSTYTWGDGMIAFHHCPGCGCPTHYTTTAKAKSQRAAINGRMIDPELTGSIRIRHFDGALTWKFIDEPRDD